MGLETGTYIDELVTTNPIISDPRSEGDDHFRLIKNVLKNTFPGFAGRASRWQAKGGAYTPVLNDNWSLIESTAAITLNLTAAATLGNGWLVFLYARGGSILVDPNASEQINGANTFTMPKNQAGFLACDGTKFFCGSLWTKPAAQTLTDAANIDWNVAEGEIAKVTLAGNRTVNLPTNAVDSNYVLHVIQDATGSRTLTWNAAFKWPLGLAPTLSTGANARDVFSFTVENGIWYGSMLKGMA